jgi:microcystin-dependent protein
MATITGLTAERMLQIEAASVIDSEIVNGDLILIKHDGTRINSGPVIGPPGPQGPTGPAAVSAIPGEVKLWPGGALPDLATYGKWVWADGAYYPVATYPKAAAHIANEWRTFDGASDPGASNFRVPDLRGLATAGMDAMPGGARANRMTRAVAIQLAKRTGKETHVISMPEMAYHAHGGATGGGATGGGMSGASDRSLQGSTSVDGSHTHPPTFQSFAATQAGSTHGGGATSSFQNVTGATAMGAAGAHGHTVYTPDHLHAIPQLSIPPLAIGAEGGNAAHENVQPTVFVPYIVCLDI